MGSYVETKVGWSDGEIYLHPYRLAPGGKNIDASWIHRRKDEENNEVVRVKSCFVMKGFMQEEIDHFDTYAAAPSPAFTCFSAGVAVRNGVKLGHFDNQQANVQPP